jgi:GWxTD domain-containing protein
MTDRTIKPLWPLGELEVEVRREKATRNGISARWFLLFITVFLLLPGVSGGQKKNKLASVYREWLDHDVVYIITKEERDEFLKLPSDAARDKFISDFWEIRNPSPGSPSNPYKDDFYQRIAFANARFGVGSGVEGWRTDRGRTYITLGEPQQKEIYRNAANLYPIEIWFYGGNNSSLPRAFYVLFYQRDGGGDYRFYSPYLDGPDKLVTGVEAINSTPAALHLIMDSVGSEVAKISLSLLPDEPVDLSDPRPSLQSDILLQKIKGLANLPENRSEIMRKRTARESVSAHMIMQGRNLDIVTLPVRDARGLTRLDYAVRMHTPSDLSLTVEGNGTYRYALEVRVRVFGPGDRLLFTQLKAVSESMDKRRYDSIKDRAFGYEGTLPLPPGKYRLDFQVTDWSKKVSFETDREVTVPELSATSFVIPGILLFSSASAIDDPFLRSVAPFTMGGVRFTPLAGVPPIVNTDMPLQIVYQIWAAPADPRIYQGKKMEVQYSLGRPAVAGSTQTVKDEVSLEQFDAAGSLVNGKRLSVDDKSAGNFLLTATTHEAGSSQRAYATTSYRALTENGAQPLWEVDAPDLAKDVESGVVDQERGLCLLAQGKPDEGRRWLRSALKLDPANDPAREGLVAEYFSRHDYPAVVSLFSDVGVTERTDSQTIIRIAASLQKTGDSKAAASLLERTVDDRPREGPLYLALAEIYKQLGNLDKATELERKGRSYVAPN